MPHLVPIPTTPAFLNATFHLWSPFLPSIAHRSPWSIEDLLGKLHRHEVQPALVVDDHERPIALLGITLVRDSNGELVAELTWLTGRRRHEWQHLLTDLETYLRDHCHCRKCRPICRPGWQKFLELHGYQLLRVKDDKHVVMEKVL